MMILILKSYYDKPFIIKVAFPTFYRWNIYDLIGQKEPSELSAN